MVASRSLRIIMVAACGGLLLSAFFESAGCLCKDQPPDASNDTQAKGKQNSNELAFDFV